MKDAIVQFVADIPHELATVFLSMIPVAELRFAIPWAILKYDIISLYNNVTIYSVIFIHAACVNIDPVHL